MASSVVNVGSPLSENSSLNDAADCPALERCIALCVHGLVTTFWRGPAYVAAASVYGLLAVIFFKYFSCSISIESSEPIGLRFGQNAVHWIYVAHLTLSFDWLIDWLNAWIIPEGQIDFFFIKNKKTP